MQPLFKTFIYSSIGFYLKEFSSKKSKCTRNNEKKYFSDLYQFLTEKDIYYMDEITCEILNKYKLYLLGKVSASTVNRQFNTLKNFFNIFTKKMQVLKNPCLEIKIEKIKKPKIELWSKAEFDLVLSHLDPDAVLIMKFIWLSGARNIEAVDLVWTDVDHDNNTITLRSRKSADHSRVFPITDSLSKLLHSLKVTGLYVFGGGSKFTSDSLGKKVKKAVLLSAKNKSITTLGIRHTFCKDLLKSGLSRPVIQQLMGHKDWRTTEHYTHWENNSLKDALNTIR